MRQIRGDGFSRREFASVRTSFGKSTVAAARLISVIFCLDYTWREILPGDLWPYDRVSTDLMIFEGPMG